ncbi:PAS domain S-box protein [Arcicella rosea]|uniref:histidine kinase n=1 Tax=Arcicella rosea TaxID=502909 RepID=A0A841ECK9_9BACT|nr:PAS domain S-box protein [Arcicella rosea]MBB6001857.1 PAS domain S-box-containing protein [Arcicella rosea]
MSNPKEELYSLIKSDFSIFDFIQEAALDGFGYLDVENQTNEWMNPKFWTTLGYNPNEIPENQSLWRNLIHSEDAERFFEQYKNTDKPYDQIIRFKHRNGSTVWFHCRALVISDSQGEAIRVIISFTDVTELMRKEEFLERCNAAAMVGYWELEIETQKLQWSNITNRIHEVDDDFVPNINTAIDFYEEGKSREKITELVNLAITEGKGYDLDSKIITAKGNIKWVRAICQSEFYEGNCIRIYGTFQDIHAQKIAQDELLKEKQKLQSVIEGTNAGIWEWNVQTGETIFNERWAEIVGYTLEELSPISIDTWLKLAHPDDLKISEQKIKACFDKEEEYYQCECRIKHKDGHWVWVLDRGRVVNWTNEGLPLMMYGTHTDISEQKKRVERNTVFIEHTPTAIAMFDNSLRYLAVSEKWRTDYNLEGVDLIGKSHYEIFPEIGDEWKKIHQECLQGKSIKRDEDPFVRKDGSVQWLKWEVKPWYTEDYNNIGGIIMYTDDITERKKIEQSLLENHTLLETILESIDIGIVACDQHGSLTLFNNTTKRWHGLPIANIPPTEFSDYYGLYHLDGKTKLSTEELPLIRTLHSGNIHNVEMIIAPNNGPSHIVSTSGSQLKGPNGELFGAVIAMHDITERRKALEKLQISEEAFRGNFENAAIGMALLDIDGKWLKINQRIAQLLGYSEEEILELTFQDITHPDDLATDLALVNELIIGKRLHYQMEKRYIHKNGSIIYAILAVSLVRSISNTPLYFISQIIDITPQKIAELQLQETLSKNQALFDSSSKVSIIGTDTTGRITIFNKGAENLLGYQREDVLYKENPAIIHLQEEVLQRANELSLEFNRKIEGFETFIALPRMGTPDTREWTYVRKDGTKFPVQLSVTAIKVKDEIVGYMGVAVDISEIKKVEKEIKSLLDVTKDQNERLKNFAHIVSHNLRSHSGNISMLLDILLDENPELSENEFLSLLKSASVNLGETIAHLNEVVLMNTTVIDNLKGVGLFQAIENAIQNVSALARDSKVTIFNNINTDKKVFVIPAYLDSIILNFLTNAIKYHGEERDSFIKLSTVLENDYLVLKIEDNGLGIDLKRHGAKLFGLYKTFHTHKDARGVGLFITKNQIEAMGGKVEVTSEVNKGTTFSIYLKHEKN